MKKLKDLIPVALFLAAISIFVYYIQQNWDRIVQLADISPTIIILLVVLVLFTILQNGLINYLLYQSLGVDIDFISSFGLASINTLANQLPFSGGLIAKGVYLKKRHNLSVSHYLSATAALFICFLGTNGLIGLCTLGYLHFVIGKTIPAVLPGGFGFMSLSMLLLFIPIGYKFIPDKFKKYYENITTGWGVLIKKKGLLIKLVIIQLISVISIAFRLKISFMAFSQEVSLAENILFSSATILTRLVSLVPGGLGIREGIVAALAAVLDYDPGISAVTVGLDRLISTVITIILGLYFSYYLGRDSSTNSS